MADELYEEVEVKPAEVPYGTEYAKSGRASCKGCKESINKENFFGTF